MTVVRDNHVHRVAASGLLLLVAILAACSGRDVPTAASADAVALSPAGFIGDRPYTWSLTCHGGFVLFAEWFYTQNGVPIAGGSANCSGDETLNGTGVRPDNANGFSADVGTNSNSWSFDPAGPFNASLSGSMGGGGGHCYFVCPGFRKESGKLTVDS